MAPASTILINADELDSGATLEEDPATAWLELEATLLDDFRSLLELRTLLELLAELLELLAMLLELATLLELLAILLELAMLLELATEELDSSGQADKDIPCDVVKQALSLPSSTIL